jgi:hypothetical protein
VRLQGIESVAAIEVLVALPRPGHRSLDPAMLAASGADDHVGSNQGSQALGSAIADRFESQRNQPLVAEVGDAHRGRGASAAIPSSRS